MKTKIENIAGLVWELNQVDDSALWRCELDDHITIIKIKGNDLEYYHPEDNCIKEGHNWIFYHSPYFGFHLDQCISYLQGLLDENKKE